ncbi:MULTISPECIES: DUF4124 domain-containing protein [Marinobacter]|uniref:DUF4124 domain-containing protein n=1 Tax=Marinobacter profundi TaxID=2666256 RepID=A0A2G1UJL0_9GAMM|nr:MULTISPECIES: DUF4124 domain-containing protein [Marinobacter]MBD3656536.1 DUF4124 domain-containing protein [Marinobacter sp.]PHQ14662.1 hypothetical protein CLH61_12940 [Marinobacter profundi]
MKRLTRLPVAAAITALMLAAATAEAQMYRYKDDNGRTVISNTVPHEASKRGYDILNSKGRVVDTVPPAPSAEEIAARKAEKAREEAALRQREQDELLLKRYSHPDDAVRAMHRKIQEMQSLNQLKQGNITLVTSQLNNEQSRAADLERSGREIPEPTRKKIDRLQNQIQDIEAEIETQNQAIENLKAEFVGDIERLEMVTGKKRTLPLEKPQAENSDQQSQD